MLQIFLSVEAQKHKDEYVAERKATGRYLTNAPLNSAFPRITPRSGQSVLVIYSNAELFFIDRLPMVNIAGNEILVSFALSWMLSSRPKSAVFGSAKPVKVLS